MQPLSCSTRCAYATLTRKSRTLFAAALVVRLKPFSFGFSLFFFFVFWATHFCYTFGPRRINMAPALVVNTANGWRRCQTFFLGASLWPPLVRVSCAGYSCYSLAIVAHWLLLFPLPPPLLECSRRGQSFA